LTKSKPNHPTIIGVGVSSQSKEIPVGVVTRIGSFRPFPTTLKYHTLGSASTLTK